MYNVVIHIFKHVNKAVSWWFVFVLVSVRSAVVWWFLFLLQDNSCKKKNRRVYLPSQDRTNTFMTVLLGRWATEPGCCLSSSKSTVEKLLLTCLLCEALELLCVCVYTLAGARLTVSTCQLWCHSPHRYETETFILMHHWASWIHHLSPTHMLLLPRRHQVTFPSHTSCQTANSIDPVCLPWSSLLQCVFFVCMGRQITASRIDQAAAYS